MDLKLFRLDGLDRFVDGSDSRRAHEIAIGPDNRFRATYPKIRRMIGHIDRLDADSIAGWAIAPRNKLQLTLSVAGELREAAVECCERPDVAAIYGPSALRSGFKIALQSLLSDDPDEVDEILSQIEVRANGELLKPSANSTMPRLLRERIGIRAKTRRLTSELTAWRGFTLEGWAIDNRSAPVSIVVKINGSIVDCPIIRLPASKEAANGANDRFQIEIPGYVWIDIPQGESCGIKVEADGVVISKGLPPLTRRQAASRISSYFGVDPLPVGEYDRLLALEHIRYGELWPLLEPQSHQAINAFCRLRNLENFVDLPAIVGSRHLGAPENEDLGALILEKALQDFNDALGDRRDSVFRLFKKTKQRHGLQDALAESFLFAAIPLLCASGEFDRVHELREADAIERLADAPDAWSRSAALAYFVSLGRVAAATGLLQHIADDVSDWFNSECLLYAIETIHDRHIAAEIEQKEANDFRYAFINFLNRFKGEWFTRLHDLNLIKCMTKTLNGLNLMADWMARDVVKAALRHYGLNPVFWETLAAQSVSDLSTTDGRILSRAREHFGVVKGALDHGWPQSPEEINRLRSALRFFHKHENPEAIMFLRDIVTNLLSESEKEASPLLIEGLVDDLLAIDRNDVVRVAAFPSERARGLVEKSADMQSQVFDCLRTLSGRPKSPLYNLQTEAAAALEEIDLETDVARLDDAARRLAVLADGLVNWSAQFVGCDLLLRACQYAHGSVAEERGLPSHGPWALRLGHALRRAISTTDQTYLLPAAVVATLARLKAIAKNDPILRRLDSELGEAVFDKFGDRFAAALDRPSTPSIATMTGGWPHDTLVVVYSCRKHLTTRVPAIRDTWIEDLKARAIPYVILVGDGDGALDDDVLELDVPDSYEDLPKKTLAMLDWVYRNTDAQYVVKIDDDCHLDVARYFGALSYRKFHFYGRLITRGVGATDRAWHQQKSLSARARHALDKSREPSSYADGGGGYSLSRLAIATLLKNSGTPTGKKLLVSSFFEDKLVGDLLALSGVVAADEDYYCNMRRKASPSARAVDVFETSFNASRITPTLLTHLDEPLSADPDACRTDDRSLRPKKIWPGCWPVNISVNSNSLEYISRAERLQLLRSSAPIVVAVVRNEMIMLPHFLDHYRKLGVEAFLIADNLSSDGAQEYLLDQPDVVAYSVDTEYKRSKYGVAWQQALLSNHCLGKWVVVADADEFLVFEDCERRGLADFVADLERQGADACVTPMVDMYPRGNMQDADFTKSGPFEAAPWFDSPPHRKWRYSNGTYSNISHLANALRHRLIPNCDPTDFTAQKLALFRYAPWIRLSEGVHCAGNVKLSDKRAYFAHFKYHAGFAAKIEEEMRRKQHFNDADEYRRYSILLAEDRGTFFDPDISRRYEHSGSITMFGA